MAVIEGKHWWDKEELDCLENCLNEGLSPLESSKALSNEFGREFKRSEIYSAIRRYIRTGLRPAYAGEGGCNRKPIGTESIAHGEYLSLKVGDGEWEFKHRALYKQYYGEIPEGYVVVFANKDRTDFSKENLIAVDKNKLKIMNKYNLLKEDIEATKTGTIIADIIIKTQELKKNL